MRNREPPQLERNKPETSMMNPCEEEASRTKKLKLSSSSSSSSSPEGLLSLLPDDMVVSCLARVSKSEHDSLSLVSKWHRSLLLTHELHNLRSLSGCTENVNYLCLRIPPEPNPRWFTLSPRTRRLVPVRSYFYHPPEASSIVAHGCGIYIMGGRIGGRASSSVLFLDCRSHTWTTLPSMGVARYSAVAGVVDGKIYIFGGCDDPNSSKWGEVFDPKKETWDALPIPPSSSNLPVMCERIVIKEDKLVAMNGYGICLSYIPSESKWIQGKKELNPANRCWHVIDNVVYCSQSGGKILWCEAHKWEESPLEWREVMGLEALTETLDASKLVHYGGRLGDYWEETAKPLLLARRDKIVELDQVLPGHKLSNSGPNLLIFWDVLSPHKLEIWCAEISLERRHHKETCEIRGNIVWSQVVMTLDPPPHQLHSQILYTLPLNL